MAISLTEDFKTVAELGQDPDAILAQLRSTGRPISITQGGKPAAVLLDVATFERVLRTINLVRLVAPAQEDVMAGRTRPLEEVMKEFYRDNQISGADHPGRPGGRAGNPRSDRSGQKKRRRQMGS